MLDTKVLGANINPPRGWIPVRYSADEDDQDYTDIIEAALRCGGHVYLYSISGVAVTATFKRVLSLLENTKLEIGPGVTLTPTSAISSACIVSTSTSNVRLTGDGKIVCSSSTVPSFSSVSLLDVSVRIEDANGVQLFASTDHAKVFPSGDTTGSKDRSALTRAIAAVGNAGGGTVDITYGTYIVDEAVDLASNVLVRIANGTRITVPDAFTISATINGSTTVATSSVSRLKANYVVEGTGIPINTRISSVGSSSFVISNSATSSATVTLTIYPVFNLFEGVGINDFGVVSDGWATIDGNLSAQQNNWLAAHDGQGSGIVLDNCYDYIIDGIELSNNHYHGVFLRTTEAFTQADGTQRATFPRLKCLNNGVRGIHARASGISATWPGQRDMQFGQIFLQGNGRAWSRTSGAEGYDQLNGGVFLHTCGTDRCNIDQLIVKDDYGVGLQVYGNDDSTYTEVSKNVHVGSVQTVNCGVGILLGRGINQISIAQANISGLRLCRSSGASTDITTLTEVEVPSIEDGSMSYMPVMTYTLPSAWTAAQVATIRAGMYIFTSTTLTGTDALGSIIRSVDTTNKTVTAYCHVDPLGITQDDRDGIAQSQTPGGAGNLTINGAQTSGGVSNYSVARKISIYSGGNVSNRTFTITGTDYAGAALSEAVTGPNATTVFSTRLFKTVTQIAISGAAAAAVEAGTGKARPYTTTATNQALIVRGHRGYGVYIFHTGSDTKDIEGVHVGSLQIENTGLHGLYFTEHASLIARDFSIDALRILGSYRAARFGSYEDVRINSFYAQDIARGTGTETSFDLFIARSGSRLSLGHYTYQHRTADFGSSPRSCTIDSTATDTLIGPIVLETAETSKIVVNGARCVLLNPKQLDGTAMTVGGGDITGTGSPVVWVPA